MVTLRSSRCGATRRTRVKLSGEDLLSYSNKIESVERENVRLLSYYDSDATITNILQSLPTLWPKNMLAFPISAPLFFYTSELVTR